MKKFCLPFRILFRLNCLIKRRQEALHLSFADAGLISI